MPGTIKLLALLTFAISIGLVTHVLGDQNISVGTKLVFASLWTVGFMVSCLMVWIAERSIKNLDQESLKKLRAKYSNRESEGN